LAIWIYLKFPELILHRFHEEQNLKKEDAQEQPNKNVSHTDTTVVDSSKVGDEEARPRQLSQNSSKPATTQESQSWLEITTFNQQEHAKSDSGVDSTLPTMLLVCFSLQAFVEGVSFHSLGTIKRYYIYLNIILFTRLVQAFILAHFCLAASNPQHKRSMYLLIFAFSMPVGILLR
jgi:hypothetical protein